MGQSFGRAGCLWLRPDGKNPSCKPARFLKEPPLARRPRRVRPARCHCPHLASCCGSPERASLSQLPPKCSVVSEKCPRLCERRTGEQVWAERAGDGRLDAHYVMRKRGANGGQPATTSYGLASETASSAGLQSRRGLCSATEYHESIAHRNDLLGRRLVPCERHQRGTAQQSTPRAAGAHARGAPAREATSPRHLGQLAV